MAKYLLKSKILATLNETLNKIKLAEAGAVTTPPEMDSEGNFVSSVETKKKPSARGVEIEQQIQDLSKDEVIKKAIEKIRDSVDVASDLDEIIKQILGQDNQVSDNWKVNEDHNDVFLRSKDAHIFQQNDSICLSHHGKIEIFKTVDELHQWLKDHDWPLPPAIEIHESVDLQEANAGTRANDWNRLVDLASGALELVNGPDGTPAGYKVKGQGKVKELTDFMKLGIDQGLESFAGMPKIQNANRSDNNSMIAYKLGLTASPDIKFGRKDYDQVPEEKQNELKAYKWVVENQSAFTNNEVNKRDTQNSFVDTLNAAFSSEEKRPVEFGNKKYNINQDDFQDVVKYIRRQRAYAKNIFQAMLTNTKHPLPEQFRPVIEQELQLLQQPKESYTVDDKIRELLESSKKYPWLNEMINQNLMTEEDPAATATGSFDNAVAGAGGMDISSDTTNTTTDTDTDSTFDPNTAPDLDLDGSDAPDLSSGGLGGTNLNLNVKGDEEGQIPQPNQKTYVVIDMIFKDSAEDDLQEQDSSDIMVKLRDEETGEIIEKPLNEIDTL